MKIKGEVLKWLRGLLGKQLDHVKMVRGFESHLLLNYILDDDLICDLGVYT